LTSRQTARPRSRRNETAHRGRENRFIEQKSIVPLIGFDFDKGDGCTGCIQRMYNGA
jgi:hypothetical protein